MQAEKKREKERQRLKEEADKAKAQAKKKNSEANQLRSLAFGGQIAKPTISFIAYSWLFKLFIVIYCNSGKIHSIPKHWMLFSAVTLVPSLNCAIIFAILSSFSVFHCLFFTLSLLFKT